MLTDEGGGKQRGAGSIHSTLNAGFSHTSTRIIDGIQREECSAVEEMYRLLGKGVRWYLTRHLGTEEAEGKVFDVLLVVLRAIRDGSLREPERLLGFVRTVVRRTAATGVTPKRKTLVDLHTISRMNQVLNGLSEKDLDILMRFYVRNQTQRQICEELTVTETYFRLLKSRAKARFYELDSAAAHSTMT